MEYKISELMELISDDSISLSDYDEVSPRRIKEMVLSKVQDSGRKPPKSRNLGRTLLIAAIISAFFAVSAFAIGYSINRQRQQELREQLQIDENHVGGYQEYYLPEESEAAVKASDGKICAALLSSISGTELDYVYVNVYPCEESMLDTSSAFVVSYNGGYSWSAAEPVSRDGEPMYDEEAKTLTLRCPHFNSKSTEMILGFSKGYYTQNMEHPVEISRFHLDFTQVETRTCIFETPMEFPCEELGKTGYVIGVELSSTGITWLVEHEDAEVIYNIDLSALSSDEINQVQSLQGQWARTIDSFLHGSLHMADGSITEVYGGESQVYKDGVLRCISQFSMSTIDINAVVSVTIGDTSLQLN